MIRVSLASHERKAKRVDKRAMQGIQELPRDALLRVLSLTDSNEERCEANCCSCLKLIHAPFCSHIRFRCKPAGHWLTRQCKCIYEGSVQAHLMLVAETFGQHGALVAVHWHFADRGISFFRSCS